MTSRLHDEGLEPFAPEVFAGTGLTVDRLRLQVARIAPHFRVALLTGERGVGKLTVARQLHRLSPVSREPFSPYDAVDFAGDVAPAMFRGTLFLHDVENLGTVQQAELLRRLQTLERGVRVIISTEADLKGMAAAGRLLKDLHRWFGVIGIRVAPLRDRLEDFDLLANALLQREAVGASFALSALDRMRRYGWPGNFQELRHFCRQAGETGGHIEEHELPPLDRDNMVPADVLRLDEVIERHVMDVLQGCSGNKLRAAELLGISRSTLYRMLESASF